MADDAEQLGKAVAAGEALLDELGADAAWNPFKQELKKLLESAAASQASCAEHLAKQLEVRDQIDSVKGQKSDLQSEEEDINSNLKQLQEDVSRLQESCQRIRLNIATAEGEEKDLKGKLAALEAIREAGSGWTNDQMRQKQALEQQRLQATVELDTQRSRLQGIRGEFDFLAGNYEKALLEKNDIEAGIASQRAEIAWIRQNMLSTVRAKEQREAELKRLQDEVSFLRTQMEGKAAASDMNALELGRAQEKLQKDKDSLEALSRRYEDAKAKMSSLNQELADQIKANQEISKRLNETNKKAEEARAATVRVKAEAAKLLKLQELTLQKIEETENKRADVEAQKLRLHQAKEDLDAQSANEKRRNDSKASMSEELRREKDTLVRALAKAGDRTKEALELLALQQTMHKAIAADVRTQELQLQQRQAELEAMEAERDKAMQAAAVAATEYYHAVEGSKLQELQAAALMKRIEEGASKYKLQQGLYDSLKLDRNNYSKQLLEANRHIADIKKRFRQLNRSIEALKDDLQTKDSALVREHLFLHKVEKDKEALRNDVTRLQKQAQSCEHILNSQDTELRKLNAIIAEADAEKARQAKEFDIALKEKNLLQSQLIKRDAELAALYEKLRIQKSDLANGASNYARLVSERDELVGKVATLKGEFMVAQTQNADVKSLELEAKKLESDLLQEKTRIRALTEEMERPVLVHRWRSLQDRDPGKWELLQRIHSLQKRLLEARDGVRAKEQELQEKEKECAQVQAALARQPGPEIAETLANCISTYKSKAAHLKTLEEELESFRRKVQEQKEDLARLEERREQLVSAYVKKQGATLKKEKRKSVLTLPGQYGAAAAGAGGGSRGPTAGSDGLNAGGGMNDSALLDVTAEMAAAGLATSSTAGPLPLPGGAGAAAGGAGVGAAAAGAGGAGGLPSSTVDALKDEADRMLAAYADILGEGSVTTTGSGSLMSR